MTAAGMSVSPRRMPNMALNRAGNAVLWTLCMGLWLAGGPVLGQNQSGRGMGISLEKNPGQDTNAALCLWQIGDADSSTKDLALGPNGFMKFLADPRFIVGRLKARDAWPYVHPGPSDSWAGGRPHIFSVLFNVAALPRPLEGNVVVRLLLHDSHGERPPRVEAALNGQAQSQQTPPGAGDASIRQGGPGRASRLSFEFPAARLLQGMNVVEIRNVQGSWFLYDAVQFLTPAGVSLGDPPASYEIEQVEDTPLQRRKSGKTTQIARVYVLASADRPESVTVHLTLSGLGAQETSTQPVTVRPGRHFFDVDIPRLGGWPANLTVALTATRGQGSTATATVFPHRTWSVYLVPHSHVDIGYTEVQTKIMELQKQFITDAMDFVEQHPEYQGDARFCWNVEVLWAVKDFLRQADAAQRERFLRHVRNGTIGLDALFANELTGLCSSEEMARLIGYAGQLVRDYGLQIDSAMITDVPGNSWGLIGAMGNVGVKYFDMGPNADARIGAARRAWHDRPFYWIAPDGRGRVLTWLAPFGYHRVFGLLEKPEGTKRLLSYLGALESNPAYPYNVAHLRMCTNDNGAPPFHLCQFVKDWNAAYESPRLVIGRTRDAFVALEKEFADRIPTYSGDFSPYWEDGAASSADELARNRRAAKALDAAEKIWSVAAAGLSEGEAGTPAEIFDRAWDNVLLFDEHTWGAHNSISEPDSPFVQAQWKIKQAFALDAERQAEQLVRDGLAALARRVATGPDRAVLVFNPCSWKRTDLARVELPSAKQVTVVDSAGKSVAAIRSEDKRSLTFVARDVPPLGYRTYCLVPSDKAGKPAVQTPLVDSEKGRLEGRFFSVRLDTKHAGVAAAEIKAPSGWLKREGPLSLGGFNRFLYCSDGDPSRTVSPEQATIEMAKPDSPDGAALVARSQAPGCRSLVQKTEIHSELPWVDITNTLDRDDVRRAEGLYFAFPFQGLDQAGIRFDAAWAPVRLEDDLLPGACKNWFCVQDWIEMSSDRQTAVLAPIDAPLVEIGEIHRNTRSHRLPEVERLILDRPSVFSFVMNNYWFTNYRASQPGATAFRYRLYRYDGPSDPVRTTRWGAEAREPLRTVVVRAGNKGSLPADAHSFAQVAPDHVMIAAMTGTAGNMLIRLHEIAGKRATAILKAPGFGSVAERVDLWGRRLHGLEMSEGRIRLEIGPREIATIRVYRN